MNELVMYLRLMQIILTVISDSTLSAAKKEKAIGYLGLLSNAINAGADASAALKLMTEKLESGDTIEASDFDELIARSDRAHRTIQDS